MTTQIAVPKGRLEDLLIAKLNSKGYQLRKSSGRSLIYSDPDNNFTVIPLKVSDIITYLERDIVQYAILGRDSVDEYPNDLQVLKNLDFGQCRMSLCSLPNFNLNNQTFLRIATKYPRQGKMALKNLGIPGTVISLTSSVELAPLVGLSDVILDLVETGRTLRDNGLVEWLSVNPVSAQCVKSKLQSAPDCPEFLQCLNSIPMEA